MCTVTAKVFISINLPVLNHISAMFGTIFNSQIPQWDGYVTDYITKDDLIGVQIILL